MEPLVGQITMFGGNFAPRGWAFCDGQLLAIAENEALFAILGTTYGGDGRKTFALPDLRGRAPVHAGHGAGLTPRKIGQKFGEEGVALTSAQLPEHSHEMFVSEAAPDPSGDTGDAFGRANIYVNAADPATAPSVALNSKTIGQTGGSAPHDNVQPSLCINYIIALQGTFPSRN
ncbi:tail fiber protein [Yoonia sp. SS1-5]|uniref:Phage tail protein n=1 Tax=Yoonia rhodophyticola TaxID=3137370 RepID=A0AAN0MA59_9RHOB